MKPAWVPRTGFSPEHVALLQEAAADETGELEESKGWIRACFLSKGADRQMLLQNITGTPKIMMGHNIAPKTKPKPSERV